VDRRVFRELLSAGRLPCSGGYLGREIFMTVSGRSCRNERRYNLRVYEANDSVCSGTSNFINDRRSGIKPWTCRKHCARLV